MKTCDEAQAALRSHQERFAASEKVAGAFLGELESEAANASVPGIRIAARARQELLLTFAGYGVYFRFVYTTGAEYLEYGWWSTVGMGDRQYIPAGERRITDEGVEGCTAAEGTRELFYPALDATMRLLEQGTNPSWWRWSAYQIRDAMPDAVARQSLLAS